MNFLHMSRFMFLKGCCIQVSTMLFLTLVFLNIGVFQSGKFVCEKAVLMAL